MYGCYITSPSARLLLYLDYQSYREMKVKITAISSLPDLPGDESQDYCYSQPSRLTGGWKSRLLLYPAFQAYRGM